MYGIFGGMGITCGAHRLWSHRAYKANNKMRIVLCIANAIASQNSIYEWVKMTLKFINNQKKFSIDTVSLLSNDF